MTSPLQEGSAGPDVRAAGALEYRDVHAFGGVGLSVAGRCDWVGYRGVCKRMASWRVDLRPVTADDRWMVCTFNLCGHHRAFAKAGRCSGYDFYAEEREAATPAEAAVQSQPLRSPLPENPNRDTEND